jgi:hypothetical protein
MSIALLSGHTIVVAADDKGTEVPPLFRREAIARGCAPVGMELEVGSKKAAPKSDQELRIEAIKDGINKMLDSDDEGSFGADGKPDVKKLEKILGFKITAFERDEVWAIVEGSLKG